jgi:hypothetical protein
MSERFCPRSPAKSPGYDENVTTLPAGAEPIQPRYDSIRGRSILAKLPPKKQSSTGDVCLARYSFTVSGDGGASQSATPVIADWSQYTHLRPQPRNGIKNAARFTKKTLPCADLTSDARG